MSMNYQKYQPYPQISIQNRDWPNHQINQAPRWCSVDLRDGNQALIKPMNRQQKHQMFDMLVQIGFTEIEIGFPSASDVEYQFARELIDQNKIPQDVVIQVLTPARKPHIEKTIQSIKNAPKSIIHMYNSTSPAQREWVFKKSKSQIIDLAIQGIQWIQEAMDQFEVTNVQLEYSPESFTATEIDFAYEICQAVIHTWKPTEASPIIINLPATVEMSTPNIFADQIEWFHKNLNPRKAVILSVHTHNDRGTAVAASELAVLAGAERVEGALFGNGERSGNMDIMTMAMNLYSQGIDPKLNFSDMNQIVDTFQSITQMPIHPRHPYAGDFVYTAFSGSHQDAISKGLEFYRQNNQKHWQVPYIPIDPQDIGRNYEKIIRVNSQSGKAGACHLLNEYYQIMIPKWMQHDFGSAVKNYCSQKEKELTPPDIWDCFQRTYIERSKIWLEHCQIQTEDQQTEIQAQLYLKKQSLTLKAYGKGPIDAFCQGIKRILNQDIEIIHYEEHALNQGSKSQAVAFFEIIIQGRSIYGAGIDINIAHASIKGLLSAINRF